MLLEEKREIDIVFLDVKMTGIDGIETGRKLREKNPEIIIFMETSYLEYLDDAMRFHVFRYLTKPIEQDRLFRNMDDALEQYIKNQRSHQKIQVKTPFQVKLLASGQKILIIIPCSDLPESVRKGRSFMDINVYKKLPDRMRKFNPQCNPSAVVYFDTAELERLVDLSGKSGMPESDYIRCVLEHALECGCTFMKQ